MRQDPLFPGSWLTTSQMFAAIGGPSANPRANPPSKWTHPSVAAEHPLFNPPVAAEPKSQGFGMSDAGAVAFAFGAGAAAVGAFFQVRADQTRMKAQALSLEHEAAMSAINARQAEREAQSIVEASHRDIAAVTLQAGQEKSALRAATGGSGTVVGAGSAAEVQASIDLVKEMDVRAIRVNAAGAAGAARTRAVNHLNTALLGRVSARNLRRGAGNDFLSSAAASGSLLDSGSKLWWQTRGRSDS